VIRTKREDAMEGKIIVDPNAQPMTADLLLQCLLGVSAEMFVANVLARPDRYDIWEDQ